MSVRSELPYSFHCYMLSRNLNVPHLTLPRLTFRPSLVSPIINNLAINNPERLSLCISPGISPGKTPVSEMNSVCAQLLLADAAKLPSPQVILVHSHQEHTNACPCPTGEGSGMAASICAVKRSSTEEPQPPEHSARQGTLEIL